MREEIARLVYPVFTYGIRLKERLESADPPSMRTEQVRLKQLLEDARKAQRLVDLDGRVREESIRATDRIRYALVCWLDEIFIADSAWKEQWTENRLEWDIYKTNDRAFRFWEEAQHAEDSPGSADVVEVFYLCVMLGFRGEPSHLPGDEPDEVKLGAWCEKARSQLTQDTDWTGPAPGQPRTFVPVLTGLRRFQKIVLLAGLALLIVIPIVLYTLIRH